MIHALVSSALRVLGSPRHSPQVNRWRLRVSNPGQKDRQPRGTNLGAFDTNMNRGASIELDLTR
jgi:hypothetical protein